jgi:hypothetical protein
MITQELIAYIKGQLSAGIPKEKIINDLSKEGGWDLSNIHEAFAVIGHTVPQAETAAVPAVTPNTVAGATVNEFTQAPQSIKYFEWLMYASIVTNGIVYVIQFVLRGYIPSPIEAGLIIPVLVVVIKFVSVYRIVYHRNGWAQVLLVALIALDIYAILNFVFHTFTNLLALAYVFFVLLEAVSLCFLFSLPLNNWLISKGYVTQVVDNKYWTKYIPWANKGFMVISLLLFLGLDLYILINEFDLLPFWLAMLVVMAIFVSFYFYENRILKVKYATSESKLDIWLIVVVAIRNIVFVLNFIPLIQILGGMLLVFGGVPYLIAYYFMMRARNRAVLATV